MQDLKINQLKLEVHDTYKQDEKITTNFKAVDDEDIINKVFLDEKLIKINGLLSSLEKDYKEFKLQNNKQSVEAVLVQKAVKTNVQTLNDKGLFGNYANVDKDLEDFLFTKRRRGGLSEQVNGEVQWFCS